MQWIFLSFDEWMTCPESLPSRCQWILEVTRAQRQWFYSRSYCFQLLCPPWQPFPMRPCFMFWSEWCRRAVATSRGCYSLSRLARKKGGATDFASESRLYVKMCNVLFRPPSAAYVRSLYVMHLFDDTEANELVSAADVVHKYVNLRTLPMLCQEAIEAWTLGILAPSPAGRRNFHCLSLWRHLFGIHVTWCRTHLNVFGIAPECFKNYRYINQVFFTVIIVDVHTAGLF